MMEQTCIRCKYFKIEDPLSGFCLMHIRQSGNRDAAKPRVGQDFSCGGWMDCGQHYHIRQGWIKAYNKKNQTSAA